MSVETSRDLAADADRAADNIVRWERLAAEEKDLRRRIQAIDVAVKARLLALGIQP